MIPSTLYSDLRLSLTNRSRTVSPAENMATLAHFLVKYKMHMLYSITHLFDIMLSEFIKERGLQQTKIEEGLTHKEANYVDVVEEKLNIETITEYATSPTSGAIGLFIGELQFWVFI